MKPLPTVLLLAAACLCSSPQVQASGKPGAPGFVVVAYWAGRDSEIDRYPIDELTNINYSFVHLVGNQVAIRGKRDSTTIARLVALKKTHPGLKIAVSLGGWGGCETCSDVFSTESGRREFALSAKALLDRFDLDGIDLDWEYPAIAGFPGHKFAPEDRRNFTLLLHQLRLVLGERAEITFAAGGLPDYLTESVEWTGVAPLVTRIYLMTYDLVNAMSTVTGNHTPLYSTPAQMPSVDRDVRYLDSVGVPREKIVVGAAFYGRVWSGVPDTNNGMYQSGKFASYINFKDLDTYWARHPGFTLLWDSTASAPYAYNRRELLFATWDDRRSVSLKTGYALDHGLGGIMFWELHGDQPHGGLLDAIDSTIKTSKIHFPR